MLDQEEIERLEEISRTTEFDRGEIVFEEGDEAGSIYNLTEGAIRLYKLLPNGRRQIVGFSFPGDMLGLANHGTYTCSAEAIVPTRVCRFPRAKLMVLLDEFDTLKTRLLDIAADELSQAQDQMLLLGRKSPVEKLASFLLRLANEKARIGASPDELDLEMGRADIADYLGLTIETVSRTFTKLKTDGVITLLDKNSIRINDLDWLQDVAEESSAA